MQWPYWIQALLIPNKRKASLFSGVGSMITTNFAAGFPPYA